MSSAGTETETDREQAGSTKGVNTPFQLTRDGRQGDPQLLWKAISPGAGIG